MAGEVIVGEAAIVGSANAGLYGDVFERLRQAEVQHLDGAVGRQHHVGRLQVAMHDPALVRELERFRHLPCDDERLLERQRAAHVTVETNTFDEFHHQGLDLAGALESVDLRDVGMVQRGQRLRLAFEAHQAVGIGGKKIGQDLDGNVTIELRIAGAIDLAHSARADRGADFKMPDACAWIQRQRGGNDITTAPVARGPSRVPRRAPNHRRRCAGRRLRSQRSRTPPPDASCEGRASPARSGPAV